MVPVFYGLDRQVMLFAKIQAFFNFRKRLAQTADIVNQDALAWWQNGGLDICEYRIHINARQIKAFLFGIRQKSLMLADLLRFIRVILNVSYVHGQSAIFKNHRFCRLETSFSPNAKKQRKSEIIVAD